MGLASKRKIYLSMTKSRCKMAKNRIFDFLDELAKKSGISELIINSSESIFVEKDGEMIRIDVKFTEGEVDHFAKEIAQYNKKDFDEKNPILDGNLPDGSRINIIHKNFTKTTHAITIRKFHKNIQKFDSSPGIFGLSDKWVKFLKAVVKSRMNIVVSGGTGAGKTTLLNLFLQEISPKERIISIEDTRELQFHHVNSVRLESRQTDGTYLSIRDLLKNTLRMRPDRIIVSEVRGAEVFDLLQAMNTGHEGSMTTIHSNSAPEALSRLENLFLLAGYDLPMRALRFQISEAIDFIIQIKRDREGKRYISQVTEVSNLEGDRILIQDVGVFKNDELKFNGLVPGRFEELQKHGGLPQDFFSNT